MTATSRSAIIAASQRLQSVSDDPRLEAERLLCHVLGCARASLYAAPQQPLSALQLERFETLVSQRHTGRPLAYLTGEHEFWTLRLAVTDDTLIPRADTETLVAAGLQCFAATGPRRVLELGTGSGAVALALAHERADWQISATDNSAAALSVARSNARRLGLERVQMHVADWFDGLELARGFDLILSNPPYVTEHDPHLCDPALAAEPRQALVAGPNGLEAIRRIAAEAADWLKPGGWLWLEHGWDQAARVRDLLRQLGYHGVSTRRDAGDRERVTGGRAGAGSSTTAASTP